MADIPNITVEALQVDPVSAFRSGSGGPVGVTRQGVVLFYLVSAFDLPSVAPAKGLSLREAQEIVDVSHMTIYRDIVAGKLPASKNTDGHYEINQKELEHFYAGRTSGSKVPRSIEPD